MDPLPASARAYLHAHDLPRIESPTPQLVPVSALHSPGWWPGTSRAYADWIGTPHLAPGAACALQHYTGRLLSVVVAVWALTGRLMSLRPDLWRAEVDRHGATRGVWHEDSILGGPVTPAELGTAIAAHVTPIAEAARRDSRLTLPVALGGPAASLAGAIARVHRGVPAAGRSDVRRAGTAALAALHDRARRELVTLAADEVEPAMLQQHRTTCCLIRLGRDHGACDSCPRVPAAERVARQRERHRGLTR